LYCTNLLSKFEYHYSTVTTVRFQSKTLNSIAPLVFPGTVSRFNNNSLINEDIVTKRFSLAKYNLLYIDTSQEDKSDVELHG
jgi:hypothetical protein